MDCPYCGEEMTSGFVQSAREIFFTEKAHWILFRTKELAGDVRLDEVRWTGPTCKAYKCSKCQKVIIDYLR